MKILTMLAAAIFITMANNAQARPGDTAKRKAAASPSLCAPYPSHAAYLSKTWGETPVFTGTVGKKFIMRLFANQSTGTWTMLIVHASGTSCVRATGGNGSHNPGL